MNKVPLRIKVLLAIFLSFLVLHHPITISAQTEITGVTLKPKIIIPKGQRFVPVYLNSANAAVRTVQRWYASQLGGKTFKVEPTSVIYSEKTLKEFYCGGIYQFLYKDKPCPDDYYDGIFSAARDEVAPSKEEGAIYIMWVAGSRLVEGVLGLGTGNLEGGFALATGSNLDIISGLFPNGPTGTDCAVLYGTHNCTKNQALGTIAHELGHTLKLDFWGEGSSNGPWHALGFEARRSVMGNPDDFPNVGLLDTLLNPEKSTVLNLLNKNIPKDNPPQIDKITPEEVEADGIIEIEGSNFGKPEEKSLIVFGSWLNLAPGSRHTSGQTVVWQDNKITAWVPRFAYSPSVQILTNRGLSNAVQIKTKIRPPDYFTFLGRVKCPGRGIDGAIVSLFDSNDQELTASVADQSGYWKISYQFPKDPNIKYSLKISVPNALTDIHPKEVYEEFYRDQDGVLRLDSDPTFDPYNMVFNFDQCPHIKAAEVSGTINGERQTNIKLGQTVEVGFVISDKDDPQARCIVNVDRNDIKLSWWSYADEKRIPINPGQVIQNCQPIKIVPPQKPGMYALDIIFEETELLSGSSDGGIYLLINKEKTEILPTINGSGQFEAAIGQTVNIGVQVLSADGKCIPNLPANKISLVWSGPNQDIPIEIPNLQNCQSYPVPVPEIGGVFTLSAEFFGDDNFEASASFAHLTVKKLPVKILTQVNGSAQLTPTPDEPVNIAVIITNEADECLTDLDASRIYFAWVKSSGDQLPISVDAQNCQPLSPVPLPDKTGDWKLKATFAGDQKYDEMITDDNTMATLSVINPQELIPYSAPAGQPEEDRIITEIKLDDKEVDPTNPAVVSIDLKDHGCQVDQECDYVVRIAVVYSVGDPDYFVLNLHYNPPAAHGGGGITQSCPNWIRMPNQCSGCGLANAFEQDSCNPNNTRELAFGIEDDDCRGPQWCQSQLQQPETACWINADPDNRAGSDEVCQQNHPDTNRCDQYTPGPYFDGCVP